MPRVAGAGEFDSSDHMRRRLTTLTCAVTAATTLLAACGQQDTGPATGKTIDAAPTVIATVNDQAITGPEYEAYRVLREQQQGAIPDKVEERRLVLDDMIAKALVAQYAQSAGLDQDPVVAALLREARDNVLAQTVRQKLLRERPVTEDDLNAAMTVGTSGKPLARADAFRRLQAERLDKLVEELRTNARITVN